MKKLAPLITFIILCSCNDLFDTSEREANNSAKKFTEDYFFSKNIEVKIVEFKLTKLESISSNEMEVFMNKFKKNKHLEIALRLSGQDINSPNFQDPVLLNAIDEAKRSREYNIFCEKLNSFLNKPGFIAHVYSKYQIIQGESTANKLHEDRQYLLSDDFTTLGIIQ